MVNVGSKEDSYRCATAQAIILMKKETLELILEGGMKKGDLFACARIAGIMAAKRTDELIPLCHPIPIDGVSVDIEAINECELRVLATVHCTHHTGVEMEAITAASLAAITIYDMCKAVDKGMEIRSVRLLKKVGGKSGDFIAEEAKL